MSLASSDQIGHRHGSNHPLLGLPQSTAELIDRRIIMRQRSKTMPGSVAITQDTQQRLQLNLAGLTPRLITLGRGRQS